MDQTCILIPGMHRSGTSALSGTLSLLDIDLGNDLLEASQENEKGFFENRKFFYLNEDILWDINSSWDDLFYDPFKISAFKNFSKIEQLILDEFKDSELFAIKDPRLPYLFPLYETALKNLEFTVKVIIPYRDPIEVARSLKKRNHFSIEKGLMLWAYSFLTTEKYSRNYSRVFVSYNNLLRQPEKEITAISEALNIDLTTRFHRNKKRVQQFLEPNLKHHNVSDDPNSFNIPKIIREIIDVVPYFNSDILSKKCDRISKEFFENKRLFYCQEVMMIDDLLTRRIRELKGCKQQVEDKEMQLKEMENLLDENSALLKQKEDELSNMVSSNNAIKADLLRKDSKLEVLERNLKKMHMDYHNLENELIGLYTSKSWKITRPLRMIRRLFQ